MLAVCRYTIATAILCAVITPTLRTSAPTSAAVPNTVSTLYDGVPMPDCAPGNGC
jgi:hypothetical protein